jgi:hypothetical protein
MGRALGAARLGRQHPGGLDAVHQQGQRAVALGLGAQPALQRPLEHAGVVVAMARLTVRRAVDDGAQRIRHRSGQGPGQTHDFVARGRHSGDGAAHIGLIQGRRASQGLVGHQPEGEHIALCRLAHRAQFLHRAVPRRPGVSAGHLQPISTGVPVSVTPSIQGWMSPWATPASWA